MVPKINTSKFVEFVTRVFSFHQLRCPLSLIFSENGLVSSFQSHPESLNSIGSSRIGPSCVDVACTSQHQHDFFGNLAFLTGLALHYSFFIFKSWFHALFNCSNYFNPQDTQVWRTGPWLMDGVSLKKIQLSDASLTNLAEVFSFDADYIFVSSLWHVYYIGSSNFEFPS